MAKTPIDVPTRELMAARAFLGENQMSLAAEYGLTQQTVSRAAVTRREALKLVYEAGITEGLKRAREEQQHAG